MKKTNWNKRISNLSLERQVVLYGIYLASEDLKISLKSFRSFEKTLRKYLISRGVKVKKKNDKS